MLFDLQSRRRRTAVRIIYLGLAILLGGGLLLFGIGTGTGGGGLFDVFRGGGSSAQSQVSSAEKHAAREVRLHPNDPQAWYALAYARMQTAGLGNNYDPTANGGSGAFTSSGRAKLVSVSAAWERYLELNPPKPNVGLAHQMANAYSPIGLDQPANAATAMEIVTQQQPSEANFAFLAQYAYMAGQFRKGDLAAGRAVQLAPSAQQRQLRTQLDTIRREAARQAAQQAIQSGGGASGG
jgi:hypothetical protein